MAGDAANFYGLVESGGLVVGIFDPCQRRQYRDLVRAVSSIAAAGGERCWCCARHRNHAAALCGLCVRLRVPLVPAARRCSAHLPVRHLAVERRRRPLGRDRGRNRLRGAVGDHPLSARHPDRRGHHRERRARDRAADRDRGMFFVARGADHQISAQRDREFALGCRVLHRRRWSLSPAAGVRRCGAHGADRVDRSESFSSWRS